jgi:hypothetical protein
VAQGAELVERRVALLVPLGLQLHVGGERIQRVQAGRHVQPGVGQRGDGERGEVQAGRVRGEGRDEALAGELRSDVGNRGRHVPFT